MCECRDQPVGQSVGLPVTGRDNSIPPPDCPTVGPIDRFHETSNTTLPASPLLIAEIASSNCSSGKRWVITAVGSNWPDRRKCVIWIQVSYIYRPTTPYTVIPLKMISV